jgi:hypothetical protein
VQAAIEQFRRLGLQNVPDLDALFGVKLLGQTSEARVIQILIQHQSSLLSGIP